MDLAEFRERAKRGEHPREFTLDEKIEYRRAQFELSKTHFAKYGRIDACIALNVNIESDRLFFDWLTSTTHDAYLTCFRQHTGERLIKPFNVDEVDGRTRFITFFPKGATRDEIARSLNVEWY